MTELIDRLVSGHAYLREAENDCLRAAEHIRGMERAIEHYRQALARCDQARTDALAKIESYGRVIHERDEHILILDAIASGLIRVEGQRAWLFTDQSLEAINEPKLRAGVRARLNPVPSLYGGTASRDALGGLSDGN